MAEEHESPGLALEIPMAAVITARARDAVTAWFGPIAKRVMTGTKLI